MMAPGAKMALGVLGRWEKLVMRSGPEVKSVAPSAQSARPKLPFQTAPTSRVETTPGSEEFLDWLAKKEFPAAETTVTPADSSWRMSETYWTPATWLAEVKKPSPRLMLTATML